MEHVKELSGVIKRKNTFSASSADLLVNSNAIVQKVKDNQAVSKEGELRIAQSKKKCYFILAPASLYYSDSKDIFNRTLEGDVSIAELSLKTHSIASVNKERFSFDFVSLNDQQFHLTLTAASLAEMEVWVQAIQDNMTKLNQKAFLPGRHRIERSLFLRVWGARKIPPSNAYCTIIFQGVEVGRTDLCLNSNTPHWDSQFQFKELDSELKEATITLNEQRENGDAIPLGSVNLSLDAALMNRTKEERSVIGWFSLMKNVLNETNQAITFTITATLTASVFAINRIVINNLSPAMKKNYKAQVVYQGQPLVETGAETEMQEWQWPVPENPQEAREVKLILYDGAQDRLLGTTTHSINEMGNKTHTYIIRATTQGEIRVEAGYTETSVLPDSVYDNIFSLFCESDMKFCLMIYQMPHDLIGEIAEELIKALEVRHCAVHFIKVLIELEIHSCTHHQLLFRANTLATKALDAYMRLIGLPHLKKALAPILTEIFKGKKSCEIDYQKLEDTKLIKKHSENLIGYVTQIFEAVQKSLNWIPLSLRNIMFFVRKHIRVRWPDEENVIYIGPASFFFLRFVCPVIVTPALAGFTEITISKNVARDLTLIAKVLQALANFTNFGQKEGFMISANDFLELNRFNMKKFLDKLCTIPETPIDQAPLQHSDINWGMEMAYLTDFLLSKRSHFEQAFPNDPIIDRMKVVLDEFSVQKHHIEVDGLPSPSGTNATNTASSTAAGKSVSKKPLVVEVGDDATPEVLPDASLANLTPVQLREEYSKLATKYVQLKSDYTALEEKQKKMTNAEVI